MENTFSLFYMVRKKQSHPHHLVVGAKGKTCKRKRKRKQRGPFFCYCLVADGRVYTGKTNDCARRLRQHNAQLSGGAKYTRGRVWKPMFHVCGFSLLRHVLQFEIAMKKRHVPVNFLRKHSNKKNKKAKAKTKTRGPGGRVRQLEYLLSLGKLNDEAHGTHKGLNVRCFMPKREYLRLAGMSEAQFNVARKKQDVPFRF